jgi:hypothetical protein
MLYGNAMRRTALNRVSTGVSSIPPVADFHTVCYAVRVHAGAAAWRFRTAQAFHR